MSCAFECRGSLKRKRAVMECAACNATLNCCLECVAKNEVCLPCAPKAPRIELEFKAGYTVLDPSCEMPAHVANAVLDQAKGFQGDRLKFVVYAYW